MEDYMSFKPALRGFDKDEVLEYIRRQEEEANMRIASLEKDIRKRDKIISELKNRIVLKDEQVDRMEKDIREKYQKYIDNYRQIGDLVYESKVKSDRIIEEAHIEAGKILANAEAEARKRITSVQQEITQRLADGKQKYVAVQDEMNEIVELFNQMQKKFMQSYKEVHELIQSMPVTLGDIGLSPEPDDEDDEDFDDVDLELKALGIDIDFDEDFDADDELDADVIGGGSSAAEGRGQAAPAAAKAAGQALSAAAPKAAGQALKASAPKTALSGEKHGDV